MPSRRTSRGSTASTVDPRSEVLVTVGATEAIAATILALCEPGDEVVTFEPYYDSYAASIALAGAVRRTSVLRFPDFAVDEESLRAAFSTRTRMVLLNTPHNPTGKVFTPRRARADLFARKGVRRLGGHRRGLRAPGLRRRRARAGRDPAGDVGAHADDLVGRQDVLRDRLEGRLGERAGRGRGGGARGQAVPHLRGLRAVPARGRRRRSASTTRCMPGWPARWRASATCSWPGCGRPGSRCRCPAGRTSSSPTPRRSEPSTPWRSAASCPRGPGSSGCRCRCSTTTSTRPAPWCGSRSASATRCCTRRWPAQPALTRPPCLRAAGSPAVGRGGTHARCVHRSPGGRRVHSVPASGWARSGRRAAGWAR